MEFTIFARSPDSSLMSSKSFGTLPVKSPLENFLIYPVIATIGFDMRPAIKIVISTPAIINSIMMAVSIIIIFKFTRYSYVNHHNMEDF